MCLNRSLRKPAASLVREEFSALAPLLMRQATSAEVSVISPDSRAFPKLLGFSFCLALRMAFKLMPTAPSLGVSCLLLPFECLVDLETAGSVDLAGGGGWCEGGGGGGGGGGNAGGGGCEDGGAGGGGRSSSTTARTLLGTGGTGGGMDSVFFGLLTLVLSVDFI